MKKKHISSEVWAYGTFPVTYKPITFCIKEAAQGTVCRHEKPTRGLAAKQ